MEKDQLNSPLSGPFTEAAEFVRLLLAEGKITREEALRLTEEAYQVSMRSQLMGIDVKQDEHPDEWPPTPTDSSG